MRSWMCGDLRYADWLFDGVARSRVKERRDAAGLSREAVLCWADSSISSVCRVAPKQRVSET
jgi:hypothetical protein